MRIAPDTTVLDLNHPLAGQPIMVTLVIMTIEIPEGVDDNTCPATGILLMLLSSIPQAGLIFTGPDVI